MLTRTLSMLGGLGRRAEARLWREGVFTWDDLEREAPRKLSARQAARVQADIATARQKLAECDWGWFLKNIPAAARIRILPHVTPAYFDVETTGLGCLDVITTAALYSPNRPRLFVRQKNLDALPPCLSATPFMITYCGTRFDLQFLRRDLKTDFEGEHLDLAPCLRAWGYRGGLKTCEHLLAVSRTETTGVDGAHAVRLWEDSCSGNRSALDELLRYNLEDVLVLERIAVRLYNLSMERAMCFSPLPRPAQKESRTAAQQQIQELCSLTI